MSCPTCDHTMQRVGQGVFWCPRCGTLRTVLSLPAAIRNDDAAPRLVDSMRDLIGLVQEAADTEQTGCARFEIHQNDAGTVAYRDSWVDPLRNAMQAAARGASRIKEAIQKGPDNAKSGAATRAD